MDTGNKVKKVISSTIYHIWKYSFLLLPIPLGFLLDPLSSKLAEYIFSKLELTSYTEVVYRVISLLLLFCMMFLILALWNIVWDRMSVVSKVFVGMFFGIIFFLGLEALALFIFNSNDNLSFLAQLLHGSGLGLIYTIVFLLALVLLSLWLEWGDSKAAAEEDEYLRDMIRAEVEAYVSNQSLGNVFKEDDNSVSKDTPSEVYDEMRKWSEKAKE